MRDLMHAIDRGFKLRLHVRRSIIAREIEPGVDTPKAKHTLLHQGERERRTKNITSMKFIEAARAKLRVQSFESLKPQNRKSRIALWRKRSALYSTDVMCALIFL